MYESDVAGMGSTAQKKISFMNNNFIGFFFMSMMAGLYIGIGSVFMGVIGGYFSAAGSPATKLVTGTIFSVGLCMVVLCGAELFTGNNLVMSVGAMTGKITWLEAIKFWVICWIGNLVGSVIMAGLFTMSGIPGGEEVGNYMAGLGAAKMSASVPNLIGKGILCNLCVCIAIWGCARIKSEAAKIMMCFCCVAAFVGSGFEHSIANMTFLSVALMNPHGAAVSIGGMVYNLLVVTLANMVGGIVFVALPYYLTGREKN